ncbi:MAG: hypothetical protein AVDCRST_MAG25-2441 [uncultured Rubrobacteraceae bacterium]|uniref:Uncharacterized protein n=1 Tax=uncultured Rubrobacteraceae bacterium TaxID=349277 RepID=A0A6J4RVH9_9ACTN|nr:MAG: hypothetical protein AVDCRST_MAG25-2441 [uncultured Rubrobacteraceae bacterium]
MRRAMLRYRKPEFVRQLLVYLQSPALAVRTPTRSSAAQRATRPRDHEETPLL